MQRNSIEDGDSGVCLSIQSPRSVMVADVDDADDVDDVRACLAVISNGS